MKIKGLSLNEIQNHLLCCHNIIISIRRIRKIICDFGKKARNINCFYDKKVLPKIKVTEADEIYQGRDGMYIGIVDKNSTYLVSLKQVNSKNTDSFQSYFSQFTDQLTSLVAWVTDGLNTYNPVLDSTYPDVAHIICHVHTYRDVMKEQDVYNRKACRKYTQLQDARKKLVKATEHLENNQIMAESAKNSLDNAENEREKFYLEHGIKKYSRATKFRTQRLKFKNIINNARAYLRSYQNQVKYWEKKVKIFQKEMKNADLRYQKEKIVALQSGRLVKGFKDLIDSKWDEFEMKEDRLVKIYARSPYPIAKKLIKIIKNKRKVFRDKTEQIQELISPNRANTNTIESIFGRYRLFFKKYRKMKDTNFSEAVFEILRLHHNLSPPYTGPNNHKSPIMRAGIQTKYRNSLDRLCGLIS